MDGSGGVESIIDATVINILYLFKKGVGTKANESNRKGQPIESEENGVGRNDVYEMLVTC